MVPFTQGNRALQIKTPLGADAFLLTGFSGSEGVSRLFQYQLEVYAATATAVPFADLLGKDILFSVDTPSSAKRSFHGICNRITQGGREQGPDDTTFTSFRIDVVPKFWLLTRQVRS